MDGEAAFVLTLAVALAFLLLTAYVWRTRRSAGSTPLRTSLLVVLTVLCVASTFYAFMVYMVVYQGLGD
jgi:hypothetical protein